MGTSDWFDADNTGMTNGGSTKKRLKGRSGLGYSGVEAMEIDPVSRVSHNNERSSCPLTYQNVIDWDHFTIKGTSTKLEKSYLRLTSVSSDLRTLVRDEADNIQEPSPADIRPLPILKQTLNLLKTKWKDTHNYAYAVDQFKSMRQDLTVSLSPEMLGYAIDDAQVQRIKNDFTVEVYEIHARIALEAVS